MDKPDLSRAQWRKSSLSSGNGQCVEVARNLPGIIAVRDSKDPHGPALILAPDEWTVFTGSIRAGQFDPV